MEVRRLVVELGQDHLRTKHKARTHRGYMDTGRGLGVLLNLPTHPEQVYHGLVAQPRPLAPRPALRQGSLHTPRVLSLHDEGDHDDAQAELQGHEGGGRCRQVRRERGGGVPGSNESQCTHNAQRTIRV